MDVGEVLMVHLYNDGSGWFSDWFVNKITITSSKQEETFDFPCYRWVVDDMVVFQGKGESLQGVQLVGAHREKFRGEKSLSLRFSLRRFFALPAQTEQT